MRTLPSAALVLPVLALALPGCQLPQFARRPDPSAEGPRIGEVAPEIEGEDADGVQFKLSDYRGKVVVVAFWGNW
jgi:cytochrome oxidase Cu insertion factor (SCO1/SenC/PrrC family)